MMIKAEHLSKRYKNVEVFKNINIEIPKGKIISLLGASGEGKSTLLQILGLLDSPSEGKIYYHNERVDDLSTLRIREIRNKQIGFIFQFHHLFPEFTALENVCIPAFVFEKDKNTIEARAKNILDKLGLTNRLQHKPKELSGGEQQRVAIARALINQPEIIFADEPTGNLDTKNASQLHDIFEQLNKDAQQTFLIVTHNEELAKRSHQILKMKEGTLLTV